MTEFPIVQELMAEVETKAQRRMITDILQSKFGILQPEMRFALESIQNTQTLNDLGLSVSKTFPHGTLVMSIAANIGDVAILDFEACFPDSMVGLIPSHKTDLNFLYYMMRAMKGIMLRSAVISTQLNLNNVRIGTNFAAFPPMKEQKVIGEYLDAKEQEALAVKETLNQQIATLTAYRKSLIHECVTGQRRITEVDVARAAMKRQET